MKKIDEVDLNILKVLYRDSRLSNKDLATKLDIAASTSLERVKRLHQEKILLNYTAEVDYKSLGTNLQAMASVSLDSHTPEIFNAFRNDTLKLREVISLFHMGGENDFQVHIAVSDVEHLRDFIYAAFTSRKEVKHVETALVYEHCRSDELPYFEDE
jgi:DNA-binding Lrp family transcriptional regulator